jgi:thioredoxin-like negative regulator of GroEL
MKTKPDDHITADDFENEVSTCPFPVLVYFYRKLCHGCQQLAPSIDTLSHSFRHEGSNIKLFKCDDDQLMRRVKVFFVPQLILFFERKNHWIERKVNTPDGIREEVSRILSAPES